MIVLQFGMSNTHFISTTLYASTARFYNEPEKGLPDIYTIDELSMFSDCNLR